MRLDHLLSREFFILLRVVRCSALPAPPCLCGGGWGWSGRVRWGCSWLRARGARPRAAGVSWWAWVSVACSPPCSMVGGGWWGACCRVLGRCALVVVLRVGLVPFLFGVGLACVGGLVVICIVDASIFVLCVVIVVVFVWVVLCVCFFGRSVDALASGADEGRGGLR